MEKSPRASQSQAIEIKGLTKSFDGKPVLGSLDMVARSGEIIVLFGPNGAGKTTLIKVLATIINPTSGNILVDGLSLKDNAEEVRRRIGVVTHQTFLYRTLTAFENLEFYCRMYEVSNRRERIAEVADLMGMSPRLHDRISTFSRGMQQRISIARALLHRPAIMLLDEPEAGLDQQSTAMLWRILAGTEEGKRTIILTTHSLERGLELGERFLILNRGRLVYDGSKQGLDLLTLRKAYEHSTRVDA